MKTKLIFIFSFIFIFQLNGISQKIYRSDFLNLKVTTKYDNQKFLSPSYTYAYIFIGIIKDDIHILIFDRDNYESPIILHQFKIINEPLKENKTIYYTKEGRFLTHYPSKKTLVWFYEDEKAKWEWNFEEIETSNETEFDNFVNTFNIDNPNNKPNFSLYSQNKIGYHKDKVIYQYSKYFEKPIKYNSHIKDISNNDLALMFRGKDDDSSHVAIFIFNSKNICKRIILFYLNGYMSSFENLFNENFELIEEKKWVEKTNNCTYVYNIEQMEGMFVININKTKQ